MVNVHNYINFVYYICHCKWRYSSCSLLSFKSSLMTFNRLSIERNVLIADLEWGASSLHPKVTVRLYVCICIYVDMYISILISVAFNCSTLHRGLDIIFVAIPISRSCSTSVYIVDLILALRCIRFFVAVVSWRHICGEVESTFSGHGPD